MDTIVAVANEIILREAAAGRKLDAVRLHKLLYLVQVYSILDGTPAFTAPFEAWDRGPVLKAFRNWILGRGNFELDRPFKTEAAVVITAALLGTVATVLLHHGGLQTEQIEVVGHENMLYATAFAKARNTELDMNQTHKAYTRIHPADPVIATPVHTAATEAQEKAILQLNRSADNQELLADLIEENFPLVMSLIVTHREVLNAGALADVVEAVADHWWAAPVEAVNMLKVALHSPTGPVQEEGLKGLISIAGATWDEDVQIDRSAFARLQSSIETALGEDRLTDLNRSLRPYLNVVHRNLPMNA